MQSAVQNSGIWNQLSGEFASAVEAVQGSVVTVYGGHRSSASGIVWRPGVIVTVRQGIRRSDALQVAGGGAAFPATLAGTDAGTDLAVLRVESGAEKAIAPRSGTPVRVGEVVLAVGRSGLGDISASAGIVARLGKSWRTFRGGQMDSLLRPDVQLYVGQAGSALVDHQGHLLGINSTALARNAVITVPTATMERVVSAILERGHVPQPFLGAAMQSVPTPEAVRNHYQEGAEEALLVLHVESQGPAARAGILVGDLVHSFNGQPVHNVHQVQHLLQTLKVGDSIPVAVLRGGSKVDLAVVLGDRA